MRVGFVGATGLMGHGMAKNIVTKGHELSFTLRRERDDRVADLEEAGATKAADNAALGHECEIVVICVTSAEDVEEVVLGDNGLLTEPREGMVIVDASTSEPTMTHRLAEAASGRGVGYVDAPLTKGPAQAEEGTLNTILGGADEHKALVRPVIETYSAFVLDTGGVGSAHTIKLLNNTVIQAFCTAMAEAMGIAAKSDVEPRLLVEILSKGVMNSTTLETMGRALDGDFHGMEFYIDNARKDVRYYARMAADLGYVAPLGSATHATLSTASAFGHGQDFVPAMVRGQEKLNGVNLVR